MTIGYVLKRYPRFSETFIVSEILAHEAAGVPLRIFSLRPPSDTHFQDIIGAVQSPVTYLPAETPRASAFWQALAAASDVLPNLWRSLENARTEEVLDVHQAALLAVEAKKTAITHLHAHFASTAVSVARLAARFAGVPYTFTAHAKDIFHESVRIDDLRRKCEDAAAVVTVSDYNLAYLRRVLGAAAARVQRVYNGLDLGQFTFAPAAERTRRILAIGRLVEKKGFHHLVDACAILAGRGVELECQIVGGGDQESLLRQLIARHGLEERVSLLGPRPQREVKRLMHEAAVFAAPCITASNADQDGLPTVLLEAMALGTPCVSTDVTGIPEIVRHEVTGLQVPQGAPAALAGAIERLLDDAPLRVRLSTAARQLVEQHFDIRRNAAHVRSLFESAPRVPRVLAARRHVG
jgi:glycosyltransferase involved in cell wall biosynthesis